jgi:hypothetical protein
MDLKDGYLITLLENHLIIVQQDSKNKNGGVSGVQCRLWVHIGLWTLFEIDKNEGKISMSDPEDQNIIISIKFKKMINNTLKRS